MDQLILHARLLHLNAFNFEVQREQLQSPVIGGFIEEQEVAGLLVGHRTITAAAESNPWWSHQCKSG